MYPNGWFVWLMTGSPHRIDDDIYPTLDDAIAACQVHGPGQYRVGNNRTYRQIDVVIPESGRLVHARPAEDWAD